MKPLHQTLLMSGLMALCCPASATVITVVTFPFNGDGNPVCDSANITTATGVTKSGSVSLSYASGTYLSTAGYFGDTTSGRNGNYWSFTITPAQAMSLNSLNASFARAGSDNNISSLNFEVANSSGTVLGSGSFNLSAVGTGFSSVSGSFGSVSLSAANTYTFSFYAPISTTHGSLEIDDLQVEVTPVPEPANVALLIFAGVAGTAYVSRRALRRA